MLEQIMTVGFVTAFLTASVRMAVPLIYAGLGETISEKAGILNIGMEGVMLGGAFFSFAGTFYSGSLAVGLLCGMAGGAMVSAIHGLLSIRLAQDQSVSGIAINIFMAGVTSFLYKLMSSGQSYQQIEPFAKLKIPFLGDIPLIGNALFNQDVLTYGGLRAGNPGHPVLQQNIKGDGLCRHRGKSQGRGFGRYPRTPVPVGGRAVKRYAGRTGRSISGSGAGGQFF